MTILPSPSTPRHSLVDAQSTKIDTGLDSRDITRPGPSDVPRAGSSKSTLVDIGDPGQLGPALRGLSNLFQLSGSDSFPVGQDSPPQLSMDDLGFSHPNTSSREPTGVAAASRDVGELDQAPWSVDHWAYSSPSLVDTSSDRVLDHQSLRDAPPSSPGETGAAMRGRPGPPTVRSHGRKGSSKNKGAARDAAQVFLSEEDLNCLGEETPPLIKSTCPEEERFILESRWSNRHQEEEYMWARIRDDFARRFNKTYDAERLKVMLARAQSRYIEWLPQDENILRQAWCRLERQRYHRLMDLFTQMGGSGNMFLGSSDIQLKVGGELNLEDRLYMAGLEDGRAPKRPRGSAKKRTSKSRDAVDGWGSGVKVLELSHWKRMKR